MNLTREKLSAVATVAIHAVRLIQLGSVAIAGYVVCYLIFMHHNHYCAWYDCGPNLRHHASVPIGEVLFIIASCLVTIEWMLFAGNLAFQAKTGKPALFNVLTQFACACFALFVYSIGLMAFASIPTARTTWPLCYNMWRVSVYDSPEEYFCIVTQTGMTSGLISWIMTMLVAALNLFELRKNSGIGAELELAILAKEDFRKIIKKTKNST
ncbi:hypothetical protein G7Z17_g5989 [Cylindrodendrum hubeiense]|uniref:Uncharacterized protein n=1 Tax=Cylindrodendrum hubeiense TaxID=595255 RepID=A0A9P5LGS4_9HYPO|nr:hypothetical protein G7Z17_g5989 [Cylindrodendrum hubeiense]